MTRKCLISTEYHAFERQNRENFSASGGCNGHTEGADQDGPIGTRSGTRSGVGAFGTGTEQRLRRELGVSPSHGRQGADAAQKTHFRAGRFDGVFESADVW